MSFQEDVKSSLGKIQDTQTAMLVEQGNLRTTLVGMNGDEGLVGEIKQIKTDHTELNRKVNKLWNRWWLLAGGIVVATGGSVTGLGLMS